MRGLYLAGRFKDSFGLMEVVVLSRELADWLYTGFGLFNCLCQDFIFVIGFDADLCMSGSFRPNRSNAFGIGFGPDDMFVLRRVTSTMRNRY